MIQNNKNDQDKKLAGDFVITGDWKYPTNISKQNLNKSKSESSSFDSDDLNTDNTESKEEGCHNM